VFPPDREVIDELREENDFLRFPKDIFCLLGEELSDESRDAKPPPMGGVRKLVFTQTHFIHDHPKIKYSHES